MGFYSGALAGPIPKSVYGTAGPYHTPLAPEQEAVFQQWVKQNKIPWQDSPTSDYDMRGYWLAQQSGDPQAKTSINPVDKKPHYPDTFKTPYHKSFSNESMYAQPGAPHWVGQKLVPTQPVAPAFPQQLSPVPLSSMITK
jgi:hypothetical protein